MLSTALLVVLSNVLHACTNGFVSVISECKCIQQKAHCLVSQRS